MTLEHDPRTGTEESGFVSVPSGDGDAHAAVSIPSDALFKPTGLKIEYADAATTAADVALYDEPDGTTAGNVSDQRDNFDQLASGDRVEVDATYGVFEDGVSFVADGNQDDVVEGTVYGVVLTDLKDMAGF